MHGWLQTGIAAFAVIVTIVSAVVVTNTRLASLEAKDREQDLRLLGLEQTMAADRDVLTNEMIELLKLVHTLKGQMRIETDARGPR